MIGVATLRQLTSFTFIFIRVYFCLLIAQRYLHAKSITSVEALWCIMYALSKASAGDIKLSVLAQRHIQSSTSGIDNLKFFISVSSGTLAFVCFILAAHVLKCALFNAIQEIKIMDAFGCTVLRNWYISQSGSKFFSRSSDIWDVGDRQNRVFVLPSLANLVPSVDSAVTRSTRHRDTSQPGQSFFV